MNKEEILASSVYKLIASQSPAARYDYLIDGKIADQVREHWNASITEVPFGLFGDVSNDDISLSIQGSSAMSIAVIHSLDNQLINI